MNSKNKNKQANRKNRSMKGKRNHQVGAPPKPTRFPNGQFTMATAFAVNKNQCQLSVRTKVDALVAAGELIQLKPRKQAKGGVGRPKSVFVKVTHFNVEKMERLNPVAAEQTAITTAIPTTAPIAETPEPAPVPVQTTQEYVAGLELPPAPVAAIGELVIG